MTIQEILNTNIQNLNLGTRAINVLSQIGQDYNRTTGKWEQTRPVTLLNIMNLSRQQLIYFKNLGSKTIHEIQCTIIEFLTKHIGTFAQYTPKELKTFGLRDSAFNEYLRYAWDKEQKIVTLTESTLQPKRDIRKHNIQAQIDTRKKEIAECYAYIENTKKLIAKKEFDLAQLQQQQNKHQR